MTVIPMLLAVGLANISLEIEPPRQFDLICEGRTANIYDPDLTRPYRWQGHLDLDARSAQGVDASARAVELQDARFVRWGQMTYDRGQNQLVKVSMDGKELTVAHCRQSPVF